jgi:hypothetical protein
LNGQFRPKKEAAAMAPLLAGSEGQEETFDDYVGSILLHLAQAQELPKVVEMFVLYYGQLQPNLAAELAWQKQVRALATVALSSAQNSGNRMELVESGPAEQMAGQMMARVLYWGLKVLMWSGDKPSKLAIQSAAQQMVDCLV